METETLEEDPGARRANREGARPGVVIVFSGVRPQCCVLPLTGDALELGRDELSAAGLPDVKVSRRHVRVERVGARWTVRDLDSKNGTVVDGRPMQTGRQLGAPVVRIGRTLFLPVHDHRALSASGVTVRGGVVMGPSLRAVHDRAAAIARSGGSLLVLGESGSGKELCAATFHAARGAGGPLVAVNCATIARELAERTLFGARRGAYTGAVADAEGLVQAAHGGTLFLDEIAELDLAVQAKLLRVLETGQVTPIGAVKPTKVDLRVCAATHKDLRGEVVAGRFREDLYFRIGRPELRLPPLRERREEIPFLLDRALGALPSCGTPESVPRPSRGAPEGVPRRPGGVQVTASVELVEACLLRRWPGNVRELYAETTTAAVAAITEGRNLVSVGDLLERAGETLRGRAAAEAAEVAEAAAGEPPESPLPEASAIEAALRAEQGNVARAAARLGVTRSRLRRFIDREGIDVQALRG